MRLIVYFDLPVSSKEDKRQYARFRKFLLEDGYMMEQFSIYSRLVLSRDAVDAFVDRLKANLPRRGLVTAMLLSERQYASRYLLMNTYNEDATEYRPVQMTIGI